MKLKNRDYGGDLPVPSTQNRFEMKALSRQHLKEKNFRYGTIMYDGTSQVTEVKLEIVEGAPMLLGVRRQRGSKVTDNVKSIRSAIEEVEYIIDTMTDCCATNMAVIRQLSEPKESSSCKTRMPGTVKCRPTVAY